MKQLKKMVSLTIIAFLFSPTSTSHALNLKKGIKDVLHISTALMIQGSVHEMGHMLVADHLHASSSTMEFFTTKDGNFFFGLNTASGLKEDSWVSYRMGGFVFSNMTYEYALHSYRQNPSTFNQTLAILSSSDFFKYSLFALYFGNDHVDEYDPAYFQRETGFSKESIILTSLSQTIINIYRLYSGNDTIIPFVELQGDHLDNSIQIGFRFKY